MAQTYTFTDVNIPESVIVGPLMNVSPLALKILYKRGYQTTEALLDVLFGHLNQSLMETSMMDTDKALPILKAAIKNKEKIVIYQDYDVDGCSAGALCLETIRAIGGIVESYVNDRELDGYGICKNGIDKIRAIHPDAKIIMTVDNGIVACEATAYAKSLGYQVIITDHHLPGEKLPDADAVIDPKRADEFYSFHELCGTGVAFKLMLALYDYMDKDNTPVINTIDLVGLATVADIVPLVGENRDLVREALNMMNARGDADPRPAIQMMKRMCKIEEVNAEYTIGFVFAPMINALSRMGEDPYIATEVLISHDEKFLREKIGFMIDTNSARKKETELETELAMNLLHAEVEQQYGTLDEKMFEQKLPSSIILYSPEFDEGIIGIVAGRLKNRYNRPTLIFAKNGDDVLKASGRSIDAFHIKNALDQVDPNLLIGYGGHAKAAGLSIKKENLEEFKKAFRNLSDQLPPDSFVSYTELDDVLNASDITVKMVQDLRILEPYGEGHRPPLFGLKYTADSTRLFGENDKHVKYWIRSNNFTIIEWNGGAGEKARINRHKVRHKVIGKLGLNSYNGITTAQFFVS